MNIFDTTLPGVKRIELRRFSDSRGFFTERFRKDLFQSHFGAIEFVQDNFSESLPGVIRGLHFQVAPKAQGKLVGVTQGRILDVAVDIRPSSPTYRKWVSTELSAENMNLLWIPAGFAHGFAVLGNEPAHVFYKVDAYYSAEHDRGIRYDDPELGIEWPSFHGAPGVAGGAIISDKDKSLPFLNEMK